MKDSKPLNYQAAGLQAPGEPEEQSPLSMRKLRIFRDHLAETPIVVVLVGTTTFDIAALQVKESRDFIKLAASLDTHDVLLAHIDYELLPQLEMMTQILGARIYVLDDVPDLERTPSEMMAVGGYRNRVSLPDYLLILRGGEQLEKNSSPDAADTQEPDEVDSDDE